MLCILFNRWLCPELLADLLTIGAQARSVAELLENRDPNHFDDPYAGLPDGVRTKIEELSPLAGEGRICVPVGLISGPRDKYFPVSELRSVGRIAP